MASSTVQLPSQAWQRILKLLDSPLDKLNLLRADDGECLSAFHHKKAEYHFISVLSVIMKVFEKYWKPTAGWKEAILQIRLVSYECCDYIDKYIEAHWETDEIMVPPRNIPRVRIPFRRAIQFYDNIKDHPVEYRSPILSRNLSLFCFGDDWQNPPEHLNILALMERIGQHLLQVYATICDFQNAADHLSFLQNLLSLLPNLRSLTLCVYNDEDMPENLEDMEMQPPFVLPDLPHLKTLAIKVFLDFDEEEDVIPNYISFVTYFPQLILLDTNLQLWREEYNNGAGIFPNLKSLRLDGIRLLEEEDLKKVFRLFKNLDAFHLDRVHLSMRAEGRGDEPEAEKNFYFLKYMCLYFLRKKNSYLKPGYSWDELRGSRLPENFEYASLYFFPRKNEYLNWYRNRAVKSSKEKENGGGGEGGMCTIV